MKILFVNNFFGEYGGTEVIMNEQAHILKSMGHEVFFFSTDKKPYFDEEYKLVKYFPKYYNYRSEDILLNPLNLIRPIYNFDAQKKLDRLIMRIKPDIVHCHNIYYHLTSSVLNVCKKHNVPIVLTLNDVRLMCPAGTLLMEGKKYCEEELCVTSKNPLYCAIYECKNMNIAQSILVSLESLFVKRFKFYDSVDAFICPSESMYNIALRYGIEVEKLKLIKNFISNFYIETKVSEDNRQDYYLFAGRLSYEKGVYDLINVFEKCSDIPLYIAGDGPEKRHLKDYCKQQNIKNIKFLGGLNKLELTKLYQNCLAVVQPSLWFETFGMTILEAFSCGRPVIAYDRGAISELVENGKTGILIEPGNINSFIDNINLLWRNKEMALNMGKNAREKSENYGAGLHSQMLLELYNSLIKK